jgi:hypothetical protein
MNARLRVVIGGHAVDGQDRESVAFCCFVGIQRRGSCRSRTNINVEYVFGGDPAGVSDEPYVGVQVASVEVIFEHMAELAAQ